MQTPKSATTISSNLLRIPRELRISILRQLLLCTPYIDYTALRTGDLQVQILRVNRKLYGEGLEILYGENYFRIKIFDKYQEERAYFVTCDHFGKDVQDSLPQFKLIQHYDIWVEIQDEEDRWSVKPAVRKVANILSGIPRIKHLRITLGGHEKYCNLEALGEEVYACSRVLQSFTLLRGVQRVDLSGGVRPRYAKYLKNVMEGKSLLDHLPKMHDALEHLAGPFDKFQDGLQMACNAMEDDDVQEFKRVRSDIIRQFVERTQYALNHLTDNDAEPDEEGEWVIERRRRSKRGKAPRLCPRKSRCS